MILLICHSFNYEHKYSTPLLCFQTKKIQISEPIVYYASRFVLEIRSVSQKVYSVLSVCTYRREKYLVLLIML